MSLFGEETAILLTACLAYKCKQNLKAGYIMLSAYLAMIFRQMFSRQPLPDHIVSFPNHIIFIIYLIQPAQIYPYLGVATTAFEPTGR